MPTSRAPEARVPNSSTANVEISYKNKVLKIFRTQCAGCHNANSPPGLLNWLDYKTAAANKDSIYKRVVETKDMPPSGKMSDSDRAIIAQWIRSGAREINSEVAGKGLIAEVVSRSLKYLDPRDLRAMKIYLKSISNERSSDCPSAPLKFNSERTSVLRTYGEAPSFADDLCENSDQVSSLGTKWRSQLQEATSEEVAKRLRAVKESTP